MAENERYRSMYERAVRQHGAELLHYAIRLCGRHDGAEDLVQETFFHAWRSIHTLRDDSRLRAWLFQILRRRHFRIMRKKRFPRTVPLEHATDVAAPLSELSTLADRESLQAGLDQLEARFKLPFLMLYLEGLSCESAARELKIPLGTLLSRVFRAKQSLRAAMEPAPLQSQPEKASPVNPYPNAGGDV
ncbi:MAG: RNA polymerase sigma factor [Phycisphaerae bacterium]